MHMDTGQDHVCTAIHRLYYAVPIKFHLLICLDIELIW